MFGIGFVIVLALSLAHAGAGMAVGSTHEHNEYLIDDSDAGKLAAYISKNADVYSGFWYDWLRGRYVVATPEGRSDAQTLSNLRSAVPERQVRVGATPVTIEHRKLSRDRLERIFGGVADLRNAFDPAGNDVRSWYVDEIANRVTVELRSIEGKIAKTLQSNYGESVHIVKSSGRNKTLEQKVTAPSAPTLKYVGPGAKSLPSMLEPSGPPRVLDSQHYYTGNRIIAVWAGNTVAWCSSAAINYSRTYMYTSGHCFPVGTPVLQGYFDAGDNAVYYTGVIGNFDSVEWGDDRSDAASIRTDTYTKRQWSGPFDTANSLPETVKTNENFVGKLICTNGSVSGLRCSGRISATRICVQYEDVDFVTCEITQATSTMGSPILAQPGDSGGPVIDSDFSIMRVMGVISGINEDNRWLFYAPMETVCGSVRPFNCA